MGHRAPHAQGMGNRGMRAFARDTGGAIAVMTALVMPVLIGVAAYAIDASLLLYRQERLQVAADIGAQAGADMLRRGEGEAAAKAVAEAMVAKNADVVSGTWMEITATFPEPGDQVQIDASLQVDRFFSQVFGSGAFEVSASGTAVVEAEETSVPCIFLDAPRNAGAVEMDNRSSLTLTGCAVEIASQDRQALDMKKDAVLTAACVSVAGDIKRHPHAQIVTTDCAAPLTDVPVLPPEVVAAPRLDIGCSEFDGKKKAGGGGGTPVELPLGPSLLDGLPVICFSSFEIKQDTTGGAGIYFFEDDIEIKDGATLTLGPGAVIVLLDDAVIDMDDDSRLILTAPKPDQLADGSALAGVAILQGRDRDNPDIHKFGKVDIEGHVMLPGEDIKIDGQGTSRCMHMLAGTLTLIKGAELAVTCSAGS